MAVSSILAVDIGNTTVAVGLFSHGGRLLLQSRFSTHSYQNSSEWLGVFQQWFRSKKISLGLIKIIIICSVVPNVLIEIESALKTFFNLRRTTYDLRHMTYDVQLIVVGRDIKVPIVNRYKNPKQVGHDRLVNAYSGYIQYGSSRSARLSAKPREATGAPLILVDFGTAVTFDVVSKRGEYLGGLIAPGLGIARDALAEKTALLPKVPISVPGKMIGKTTEKSIQSGLFYGWGALTDGIITSLRKKLGNSVKIILTGGQAEMIRPLIKVSCRVNSHLTLQGLYLLSKQISRKKIS